MPKISASGLINDGVVIPLEHDAISLGGIDMAIVDQLAAAVLVIDSVNASRTDEDPLGDGPCLAKW